jgi:hypothetical protein
VGSSRRARDLAAAVAVEHVEIRCKRTVLLRVELLERFHRLDRMRVRERVFVSITQRRAATPFCCALYVAIVTPCAMRMCMLQQLSKRSENARR